MEDAIDVATDTVLIASSALAATSFRLRRLDAEAPGSGVEWEPLSVTCVEARGTEWSDMFRDSGP